MHSTFFKAGRFAIIGAGLYLGEWIITIFADWIPSMQSILLLPIILITIMETGFSLYALNIFRHYIKEIYDIDNIDLLITVIIVFSVLATFIFLGSRFIAANEHSSIRTILFLATVVPVGLLGALLGVKILTLGSSMDTRMRTFAYLQIAAGACFVMLILAPLGALFSVAAKCVLGLILLNDPDDQVEFV